MDTELDRSSGPCLPAPRGEEVSVRDVLLRSREMAVLTVSPGTSVLEALSLMEEKDAGALVVTRGDEILGILSERDCARKVLLERRSPAGVPVSDVMSRPVCSVTANKTVRECLELMIRRNIRHLPVLFGRYLVGCVSLRDLVSFLLPESLPEEGEESTAPSVRHGGG